MDLPTGGGAGGGINLARDPNLDLEHAFDLDFAQDWDTPVQFDDSDLGFSSGLEQSGSLHQAREEDITLHEPHMGDVGMMEGFGEGEGPFATGEWEGPGLLFDEPVVEGAEAEEERRRSASRTGGFPRRAEIGELTTEGDP